MLITRLLLACSSLGRAVKRFFADMEAKRRFLVEEQTLFGQHELHHLSLWLWEERHPSISTPFYFFFFIYSPSLPPVMTSLHLNSLTHRPLMLYRNWCTYRFIYTKRKYQRLLYCEQNTVYNIAFILILKLCTRDKQQYKEKITLTLIHHLITVWKKKKKWRNIKWLRN